MGNDLVIFGEDWGGHPSSTQHLARQLARDNDIVWVNSLGMRRPRFSRTDLARVLRKSSRMIGGRREAASATHSKPQRMSIVDPRAISWPGNPVAAHFNRQSVGRQVRANLAQRGMKTPILWTSLPSAAPLIGACDERAVVYYCGDDFGALAGVDHDAVSEMEQDLAERADLIFAASAALAARFPARKTVLLPHGVDHELFSTPVARAADLPAGKPIAGFYGSLAEWIDVALLAQAAKALPHWDFVLVGPVQSDVGALAALANVHLMGARPHDALPSYAQHWDVSLLPFRDTPQIRACNPLKLREYLAAGAPVVSTMFPALAPYLDHVVAVEHGTDNSGAFAAAISRAAQDRGRADERRARVSGESWDARAGTVAHYLAAL